MRDYYDELDLSQLNQSNAKNSQVCKFGQSTYSMYKSKYQQQTVHFIKSINRLIKSNKLTMLYSSKLNAQSKINYSTSSKQRHHKCLNCGLQFQSSYELLNHAKKFCTNSGFDTLAGLNVKLKNPNFTAQKIPKRQLNDSLTNALEQIQKNKAFVPSQKQFIHDLDKFQRDRQDLTYARPYLHGSSKKKIQVKNSGRQSRLLTMSKNDHEQKNKSDYKQRNSSINDGYQPSRSKAYSFTQSHVKRFKQSKAYVSPPSQFPQLENAKQFSLLDRSDMSIKNMPQQEKRDYVIRKILQLEGIQQAYNKNGGKNQQFIDNTHKMKKFYQDLLSDVNHNKQDRFGKISNGTRVSTPISKLQQLENSAVSIESYNKFLKNNRQNQNQRPDRMKSKLGEMHQKNMAKRQQQVRKRFNTQFPQGSYQQQNYDIIDKDILSKLKAQTNKQNQVIVIPIQQPVPPPNYQNSSNKQMQLMMKYLDSMNAMKQEQSSQYMNLLQRQNQEMKKMYEENMKNKEKQFSQNQNKIKNIQKNYTKLLDRFEKLKDKQSQIQYQQKLQLQRDRFLQQNERSFQAQTIPQHQKNYRVSNPRRQLRTEYQPQQDKEYRELYPEIDNVRLLNIEQPGYHLDSPENMLSPQEKILIQMQHEQRDEYQLFSHLPSDIQQLKLQSLKSTAEKRFQMQKQVLNQKLEKLKILQTMKQFQLERKVLTQELQNQKKKILIQKLMKKKVQHLVKEHFEEQTDNDNQDLTQQQISQDPFQLYNEEPPI